MDELMGGVKHWKERRSRGGEAELNLASVRRRTQLSQLTEKCVGLDETKCGGFLNEAK